MMRLNLNSSSKILGDRYYLHHLIAQGNHSKVFLATDLLLNYRKCAIKQMYPSYCPQKMRSTIESAFLQEAEILKKFTRKHSQICQFYNYFVDAGNQYLVQEWIEGTTLQEKLHFSGKLSESETKSILLNIVLVLEHVHSQGIVHNDIKPGNIILRLQDRLPVLIDFGIARKVNANYGHDIVGTPGYMSLEQAMGKVSVNNDLYSLGLTAIHLLTGKSPLSIDFDTNKDNFWERAKTAFDPKLVEVIDRAIASESERRFTSAAQMRNMLQPTSKILVATHKNRDRVQFKSEDLIAIAVFLITGTWLCLSYFISQFDSKPPVASIENLELWASERYSIFAPPNNRSEATILSVINNALQDVIFVPGTAQTTILEALGEPLWRKAGFWANSVAWSYENIVAEGFDIGYIFDRQTNTLRQAEIAMPPTTKLRTVQSAMNLFLAAEHSNIDIEQGLRAVYQRQKKTHNFTVGNLEGIIQRNPQDRIYLAVWQANFH